MSVPTALEANIYSHEIVLMSRELGKKELNINKTAVNNTLAGMAVQLLQKALAVLMINYSLGRLPRCDGAIFVALTWHDTVWETVALIGRLCVAGAARSRSWSPFTPAGTRWVRLTFRDRPLWTTLRFGSSTSDCWTAWKPCFQQPSLNDSQRMARARQVLPLEMLLTCGVCYVLSSVLEAPKIAQERPP